MATLGINRLSALDVKNERRPGYHGDGAGLWLQVVVPAALKDMDPAKLKADDLSKSWLFRYRAPHGKQREMGLGSAGPKGVSLKDARLLRDAAAANLTRGDDPIDARRAERMAKAAAAAKAVTFRQAAEEHMRLKASGWKNTTHAAQWHATMKTYVYPVIGDVAVGDVDTAMVLKVLAPIWNTKTETASRVRGRIEAVLNAATVDEQRSGPNPARWRGHLKDKLARPSDIRAVEHHAALPYSDVGAFMRDLSNQAGVSALALRFTILTGARTSETTGAAWDEIDFTERLWTVPKGRMKGKRTHIVPLSVAALDILSGLHAVRDEGSPWVFPGQRPRSHLSNMAMLAVLKRMGRGDLTVHGFRSTFRDWAGETTAHPNEVCEMALAHTIKNKAEAAYRRGDMIDRRRQLMDDWAAFCTRPALVVGVVPIMRGAGA